MVVRKASWGVSDSLSQLSISVKRLRISEVLPIPLPDLDRLCCVACWDLGRVVW